MKKFLWVTFVTAFLFLGVTSVHADDTDLFTIRVSPDALIMLDLSGSMWAPPQGENLWGPTPPARPLSTGLQGQVTRIIHALLPETWVIPTTAFSG